MEQRIFIVKFRTFFPESLPPNKTTIQRNVKKHERNSTSLSMDNRRSGRRITIRTQ